MYPHVPFTLKWDALVLQLFPEQLPCLNQYCVFFFFKVAEVEDSEKNKKSFSNFHVSMLVMNWKADSKDQLQDNGGLLSADASTKTHVAFHHSFNTVIDKISKYVKQA